VDQINGAYEKLEVPPILDFRRATVLHDFEKNLTAIVDRDHGRCFILPLNRTAVKPPKNFMDLLEKFNSGYYVPDAKLVRDSYKVVLPPMDDILEPLGVNIWIDCQFFDTYRLERDEQSDTRRSALDEPIVMSRKKRSAACSMIGDGFCLGDTYTEQMHCVSLTDCI
jgi:integral membrane protein 2B